MNSGTVKATITITRYAEPDAVIRRSLRHALMQDGIAGEVLFIEQLAESKIDYADFPDAKLELRIIRKRLNGLSQARNLALTEAKASIVIFLDADAVAQTGFARHLARELSLKNVVVAGGRILPEWPSNPPLLAKARAVYDQYSLLDLGTKTITYHRVVGAGFGVDMAKLSTNFRFDENLGRRDGRLFGGEESDFTNRAREFGFDSVYVGSAEVVHVIEPERVSFAWIVRRLVYAGFGRAQMGGVPAPAGKRALADWLLAPVYVPPYVLGWIWGKVKG